MVVMTEPTSQTAATGPVAPPPSHPEPVAPRRSGIATTAAWVGIVAGVIFIVAVIFFTGFVLGATTAGHRGFHGDRGPVMFHHRGGPPPMFPMGPRGEFERPGPGGPNVQPPQTTAPARP